jgi:hypothetical protein
MAVEARFRFDRGEFPCHRVRACHDRSGIANGELQAQRRAINRKLGREHRGVEPRDVGTGRDQLTETRGGGDDGILVEGIAVAQELGPGDDVLGCQHQRPADYEPLGNGTGAITHRDVLSRANDGRLFPEPRRATIHVVAQNGREADNPTRPKSESVTRTAVPDKASPIQAGVPVPDISVLAQVDSGLQARHLLALQGTVGNAVVLRLLAGRRGDEVVRRDPPGPVGIPAAALASVSLATKLRRLVETVKAPVTAGLIAAIHEAPVGDRRAALVDVGLRDLLRARLDRASCLAVMTSLLEGSQKWVNPPDSDFFDYFVTRHGTGTLPRAASMNCWESILYGAYLGGQIDQPWIEKFYSDALNATDPNAAVWATLGWRTGLPIYSDIVKPKVGQLLFYLSGGDVPDHVALSLGGDDAMSLWSEPNNKSFAQRIRVNDLAGTVHIGNPTW